MAKVTIDSVTALVGQIYEAAYDQERWQDVVTGFHELFDASRACIVRQGQEFHSAVISVRDDELHSPQAVAAYTGSPWTHAFFAVPEGHVFRRQHIVDEASFRRDALWLDWFRPRDMYGGLTCKLHALKDAAWFIDIQHGQNQPDFSQPDEALFKKLMPHVLRAGQIGDQFEKKAALAGAFSYLPFGVLMVDGHRRILQMNAAAEALLMRPRSPLRAVGNVVAAANAKDTQMLSRLVVESCSLPDGAMPGIGGSMLVPSDRAHVDDARLVLSISPFLNARMFGLAAERCAVIMVRDASLANPVRLEGQLRSLFALTAKEASIALALASGLSLREIAARENITFGTVRLHLERIFRKTDTRQQSQLVAMLNAVCFAA